jgi:O-antigen ligase
MAFLLVARPTLAVLVLVAPCVLFLLAWAATGDRSILVIGSLVASIGPTAFTSSLNFGGALVYPQDALVAVAVIGWAAEMTIMRGQRRPSQRKLIVGTAAGIFALAVLVSLLRGHAAYGASYAGQPLRLVLYIGIAAALLKAEPATLFRRITVVLYAGVVWQLFAAVYHISTGTSQSTSADLSTGGFRVVSILTSLFIASALFAAIVNLERVQPARLKALHLAVILLSLIEIVLAFSRGTFISTALVLVVFFAYFRNARTAFVSFLPLCLPVLIAAAFFLPQLQTRTNEPSLLTTLIKRLDPRVNNDLSVQWRNQADNILWSQVHADPFFGVGFGKGGQFTLAGVDYHITQDAHNDYLFLLAAGGLLLIASFAGLVLNSTLQLLRIARSSSADGPERLLVAWALATLFTLLFNGLVEPLIVLPSVLLTLWILMLLPLAFRPAEGTAPLRERSKRAPVMRRVRPLADPS